MCIIAGGHYGLRRVRNSCRSFLAFLVLGKMLKIFFLCSNGSIFCGVPHFCSFKSRLFDCHRRRPPFWLLLLLFCYDQPGRKENDVIISFYSNHSAFWSIAVQSTNIPDYSMHSYSRIRSIQRTLRKGDPIMSSLRK